MKKIDWRDALFIIGLASTGYGLFLFLPWVSFVACGAIMMLAAIFMSDK